MAFNHYAKIKRILTQYDGWYVVRINQPTRASKFNGEIVEYDHFYRVYSANGQPIKYCKFQQLERFARTMNVEPENLPIIDASAEGS